LRRYREEVIRKRKASQDIEAQLAALEAELRGERRADEMPPVEAGVWEQIQEIGAD